MRKYFPSLTVKYLEIKMYWYKSLKELQYRLTKLARFKNQNYFATKQHHYVQFDLKQNCIFLGEEHHLHR